MSKQLKVFSKQLNVFCSSVLIDKCQELQRIFHSGDTPKYCIKILGRSPENGYCFSFEVEETEAIPSQADEREPHAVESNTLVIISKKFQVMETSHETNNADNVPSEVSSR